MRLFADAALLPSGWASNVAIEVGADGCIDAIESGADAGNAQVLAGPVIPAMPNLHSHAFQRALAGRTGRAAPSGDDSFWSWRQAMYAFVERVDPDAFEAIAAQAYVEMAKVGYGAVAEFHYVHHESSGRPYADRAELAHRIVAAASTAGLGLTLLPVFYAHAGFGGTAPTAGQRRFVHSPESYTRLVEQLRADAAQRGYVTGIAPHSLRAVTVEELRAVVALALPDTPIHIHAAEQTREVDACFAFCGQRPVEFLLSHAPLDARWCVVHATHMTAAETRDLAASTAVAGLAPTTEADLGDGTFPGEAYAGHHGRFGVGSDSNTSIDPFAELRQLEWSQRMRARRRNVLAEDGDLALGAQLWTRAARGGAQAVAQPVGELAVGRRADLVVLNVDDPALAEQALEDIVDAAMFGPCRRPVRDVMVNGRFIVSNGRHLHEDAVCERYVATLRRMAVA